VCCINYLAFLFQCGLRRSSARLSLRSQGADDDFWRFFTFRYGYNFRFVCAFLALKVTLQRIGHHEANKLRRFFGDGIQRKILF